MKNLYLYFYIDVIVRVYVRANIMILIESADQVVNVIMIDEIINKDEIVLVWWLISNKDKYVNLNRIILIALER